MDVQYVVKCMQHYCSVGLVNRDVPWYILMHKPYCGTTWITIDLLALAQGVALGAELLEAELLDPIGQQLLAVHAAHVVIHAALFAGHAPLLR